MVASSVQTALLGNSSNEIYEPWKITKPEHSSLSKTVKKRVRTGCFNCRRKHKKCDEQKPICKACSVRKEVCEWPNSSEPKKKNPRSNEKKHTKQTSTSSPDENNSASSNNEFKTSPPDQKALDDYTKNLQNIDSSLNGQTAHNEWISPKGLESLQTPSNHLSTGSLFHNNNNEDQNSNQNSNPNQQQNHRNSITSSSISPGSTDQNANADFPFLMSPSMPQDFGIFDLKSTLRDYMFANASNFELSTDIFNSSIVNSETNTNDEYIPFLTKPEEKLLLKNYLYKVAPWLDMFDLSRQIGLETVQLAKKSQCLRYAILALSSRQKEKTDITYDPSKSVTLYQHSLKLLIPTVKRAPDIAAISACVILCVFEMMSISPEKWRYHLEGCSALFKATGINGFSNEYERALFWTFARMDVNSAVIGEQNTMIESEKWLPEGTSIYDAAQLFKKENSYQMYANYMVFLCSRVLNLISTENDNFDKEWELLWNEVNLWQQDRPEVMKAIFEFDSSPFPEVLYDNGPAISANQLYHMAMILLMENKPRLFKINSKVSKPLTWHAKQICAISIHNDHHGCWNNAVQTLWIAGRLLTHDDEHRIILDLLNEIESTTGWAMKFRAKDLIDFWDQS